MKIKFSIRALMLLSFVVACLLWWITAPSATAKRFVEAVNSQNYTEAADLFVVDGTAAMLTDWEPKVSARAWMPKQSAWERSVGAIQGRRRVELTVTFLDENEELPGLYQLEASRRGIYTLHAPIDHNFKSSDLIMHDK